MLSTTAASAAIVPAQFLRPIRFDQLAVGDSAYIRSNHVLVLEGSRRAFVWKGANLVNGKRPDDLRITRLPEGIELEFRNPDALNRCLPVSEHYDAQHFALITVIRYPDGWLPL